ncbi:MULTISPECIES: SbtR family transcriptional regulator [Streptomyces]
MDELTGFLARLMDTVAHSHAVKAAAYALNADHAAHPALRDVETRVTRALGRLVRAAQEQGALRPDCTVGDLYLMFSTFPADQPPAARSRRLTLLLTGRTAR